MGKLSRKPYKIKPGLNLLMRNGDVHGCFVNLVCVLGNSSYVKLMVMETVCTMQLHTRLGL